MIYIIQLVLLIVFAGLIIFCFGKVIDKCLEKENEKEKQKLFEIVKDYKKKENFLLEKVVQLELNNKLLKKENEKLMKQIEENI